MNNYCLLLWPQFIVRHQSLMNKLLALALITCTISLAACQNDKGAAGSNEVISSDSLRQDVLENANNSDFMNEGADSTGGTANPTLNGTDTIGNKKP